VSQQFEIFLISVEADIGPVGFKARFVPLCRPSPAENAAGWTNGWSGEAAPQRSDTKRTAGQGRE